MASRIYNVIRDFAAGINEDALHRELAAIPLSVQFQGLSRDRDACTVFLSAGPRQADLDAIDATDWSVIGGVVTNVGFFMNDVTRAIGRIVGELKTSGTGVELRVVRGDGTAMRTASFAAPDTHGQWQVLTFQTDKLPDAGEQTYILEGRLGAAAAGEVRFVSMTLLEVRGP
jgi:hypothetical protein